jgi:hypothetical protein
MQPVLSDLPTDGIAGGEALRGVSSVKVWNKG